jgi:hypothetical protein
LGCQACTKSLITYVANIDSSYVGFFIILRSYVCNKIGLSKHLLLEVVSNYINSIQL